MPQAACATLAVLCITGKTGVQPRPERKPALTDFGLQPYSFTGLDLDWTFSAPLDEACDCCAPQTSDPYWETQLDVNM